MKKKLMVVALVALMAVTLTSCDAVVNVMGKMGKNIAKTDPVVLEKARNNVNSVTTVPSKTREEARDAILDGTELSLTFGSGKITIGAGENNMDINLPEGVEINNILPPAEDLNEMLVSINNVPKDEVQEILNEPVSDANTKDAAKGTAAMAAAILGEASKNMGEENELVNQLCESFNDLAKGDKEVTKGDIIILQAVTSVLSNAANSISVEDDKVQLDNQGLVDHAFEDLSNFVSIFDIAGPASSFSNLGSVASLVSSAMGSLS